MSQSTDPSLDIAKWIVAHGQDLTHLKVQKLCFYAYGYLTAVSEIEEAKFEAWQHGPVSRLVWQELKAFGSSPVTLAPSSRDWTDGQLEVLKDVQAVYGSLTAWQLREQSHEEAPWKDSYGKRLVIPDAEIRQYFLKKTSSGEVELPESICNCWSLRLDGLPVPSFPTFHDAANAYRAAVAG